MPPSHPEPLTANNGFLAAARAAPRFARHWRRRWPQVKNVGARLWAAGWAPIVEIEVARENAMSEPEATQAGETPTDAPTAPVFDSSAIRGLQAPPAAETAEARLDEAARLEALAGELTTRATRLSEAVDDALVLANDGSIRWLGDPIAKLASGEAPLAPRAVLLADDALPAEGREVAERRVSLWLAEHLRKALGPLIGLAAGETIPEPAREIALKVSQAYGVLERERVKAQVKALDQEARGTLRKLGVRFGAHYIFIPALLKPAARTLCAHLWALSHREVDGEGAAETLLQFASSGRTSFAVEPPAPSELYRVAGFRVCGERAVRVDIVERLTDLIRAALPRTPAGNDESDGFLVTNQMTSLTGCSGEHFASILRSLGFVSHQVKKSAYLAASALRAERSALAPVAAQAPSESAAAEGTTAVETPASEAALAEPAIEAVAPEAEAAPVAAEPEAAPGPPAAPEVETVAEAPAPEVETVAEAPATEVGAVAASPAAEPAKDEDEMIEVWRLAPRRPRPAVHHHRPAREAGAPAEARPRNEEGRSRRPWRDRKPPEGAPAETPPPPPAGKKPERSGEFRRPAPPWRREGGGKGQGHQSKGDRRDDRRPDRGEAAKTGNESPRPAPSEPRKPSVNLDSPFAKLLDLKPLLQAREKRR
jgi:ATP-dependent RNA helicase SUPV3L1/SUV3